MANGLAALLGTQNINLVVTSCQQSGRSMGRDTDKASVKSIQARPHEQDKSTVKKCPYV